MARDNVEQDLSSFSQHQGAAVVVIMSLTVDSEGEPHRQLALYSQNTELRDKVGSCVLRHHIISALTDCISVQLGFIAVGFESLCVACAPNKMDKAIYHIIIGSKVQNGETWAEVS